IYLAVAFTKGSFFSNYSNIIFLLGGIIVGSLFGLFARDTIVYLKPIGDIFLNLLFTVVIPLIFFAIASAVSNIEQGRKLGNILSVMAFVFLGTVLFAAITMVGVIWLFPLETGLYHAEGQVFDVGSAGENWGEIMVQFLTVNEFNQILSRQHMLAFIIFSFLFGLAALRSGEGGGAFRQ